MACKVLSRTVILPRLLSEKSNAGRRFVSSNTGGISSKISKSTTIPLVVGATIGIGSALGAAHVMKYVTKNTVFSLKPAHCSAALKKDVIAERTFIMIKPDGVQRSLIGDIIKRFEQKGFKLVAMKFVQPDQQLLNKHYEDLKNKPFFHGLINYMVSGPVVAMAKSLPGTIRGDYCIQVGRNIIHGSDSVESAKTEINLWFKPSELTDWKQEMNCWINEGN
ncbi:nucleoside diphosphate kinase A-like isoform X2 [Xenia sp. Carnegie-2017]|uniref:nucleoside diphosphate kinase A-like isoform X2 n=1 Tax=Xenia sp. Carnegie-2017 TaxID=2897299 RepID=UPI001F038F30|nr:nucleoside diphosphate kinase A-like isoform X2 [Xenia sp. Carnegie-2017]